MRYAQDYDLWLRIAKTGARMCRIASPVIAYRESPTQVTKSGTYLEAVRRDEHLKKSYVDLFNSRVSVVSLDPETQNPVEIEAAIGRGLAEQLPAFRSLNRLHYSHFLRSARRRTPFSV